MKKGDSNNIFPPLFGSQQYFLIPFVLMFIGLIAFSFSCVLFIYSAEHDNIEFTQDDLIGLCAEFLLFVTFLPISMAVYVGYLSKKAFGKLDKRVEELEKKLTGKEKGD